MNVKITFDEQNAAKQAKAATDKVISELQTELDTLFKNKISSPEQIYYIHSLLTKYECFTGKKYKKTFEENTIV